MDDVIFNVDGTFNQTSNSGNNSISFTGKVTGNACVELDKNKKISQKSPFVRWLCSHWFLIGIITILVAIILILYFYANGTPKNENLAFAFIGVLATFIVLGNYAQVQQIKQDFEEKTNEIINANLMEVKNDLRRTDAAHLLANAHIYFDKGEYSVAFMYSMFSIKEQLNVSVVENNNFNAALSKTLDIIRKDTNNTIITTGKFAEEWTNSLQKVSYLSKKYNIINPSEIITFLKKFNV